MPLKLHHGGFIDNTVTENEGAIEENGKQHGFWHEVPLENQYDMVYVGRVKVGKSGKTFKTLFDSGSTDIWFISDQCNSRFCKGKPAYRILQDLEDAHYTRIKYDAGTITGHVVDDEVRIGKLKAADQSFIAADTVDVSVLSPLESIPLTFLGSLQYRWAYWHEPKVYSISFS